MKQFYKKYRDIFQMETLTRTQKDIITILINRMEYHNGEPFYCYESWIADEVKCGIATVKRAIKHFADIQLLTIDRHYNKQTRKTTNFYTINIDTNGSTLVNTNNVSGVVNDYEKEEIVEPSTPLVEEEQPRVFDWDSITGNDLVQMPVTNVDEFEYSDKTEEDYDAYYESDEYKEQLRKEEEYIINNNIEEEKINDMIDYSNTYIPDELVYNDAFSIDLKDCKRVDNNTTTSITNEEMMNNIKDWLIKNIGKNKQATIYYKALKEKYGYTFREVVETAKELDRQNVITYAPTEKNGKLYHYYSLKRTSEAVEVEIIVDWLKYTTYRINQYKDECKQLPNAQESFYKNIIDDVNNSLMGFVARGGDKKTLVNLFNQQFEQYRKVA